MFQKDSELDTLSRVTALALKYGANITPIGIENGEFDKSNLSVSSSWQDDHNEQRCALNATFSQGSSAWCSKVCDKNQFLQIAFPERALVMGIATQGRADYAQWVQSYILETSDDGEKFSALPTVYEANVDQNTVRRHVFATPVCCRYLRVCPVAWHGHISMRLEVYQLE